MADTAVRRIRVADHAVEQYRERLRPDDKRNKTIRNEIAELVRLGLEQGNVLTHKPKAFRLYGSQRRGALPAGQHFVWCSGRPEVGFLVIDIDEPGQSPFVKTTLVRVMAR